jgi:hypothetical protein
MAAGRTPGKSSLEATGWQFLSHVFKFIPQEQLPALHG